jgi:hypothetical protein
MGLSLHLEDGQSTLSPNFWQHGPLLHCAITQKKEQQWHQKMSSKTEIINNQDY